MKSNWAFAIGLLLVGAVASARPPSEDAIVLIVTRGTDLGNIELTTASSPDCKADHGLMDFYAGKGVIYRLGRYGDGKPTCWRKAFTHDECGESAETCYIVCNDGPAGGNSLRGCHRYIGSDIHVLKPFPDDPHVPLKNTVAPLYVSHVQPPGKPFAVGYVRRAYYEMFHGATAQCAAAGPDWHDAMSNPFGRLCWWHGNHNVQFCFVTKNGVDRNNCSPWMADSFFQRPDPPGPLDSEP